MTTRRTSALRASSSSRLVPPVLTAKHSSGFCTESGAETKAASWKIVSTPRTASASAAWSRRSPSTTCRRLALCGRAAAVRFPRRPLEKLSRTRTDTPCSSRAPTICEPMNPAPPVTSVWLMSASFATQHGPNGAQDDGDVQHQGTVLDVVEVVLELDTRFRHARDVAIVDLCTAGQAGLDEQPGAVERDLLLVLGDELGPLGTRANQAHVA